MTIKAEYISHMGDDLTVANSARVSFSKHKSILDAGDEKLLKYLYNHKHWTPFSHPQITLRETVPIFVARQRFKHMIGKTYNEVSRRYVDSEPEFYFPDEWRGRAENKKQGSSDEVITHVYDPVDYSNGDIELAKSKGKTIPIDQAYKEYISQVETMYRCLLDSGVCPEQARMILPQSMLTTYYVTGSLYAFMNAYRLRIDSHAQKEIQYLAIEWDKVISPLYPISWNLLKQTTNEAI